MSANEQRAREWLDADHSFKLVVGYKPEAVSSLAALLDAVERDRDRLWCAALLPEGTDIVERVTRRVNERRALAKPEAE